MTLYKTLEQYPELRMEFDYSFMLIFDYARLNYNNALEMLNKLIDEDNIIFDKDLILYTHKQVVNGLLQQYKTGKYRIEPVVVNNPKQEK